MEWIAFGGLSFSVVSAVYAAIAAGFRRISIKIDAQEACYQKRHEDSLDRFARLETKLEMIERNGHPAVRC